MKLGSVIAQLKHKGLVPAKACLFTRLFKQTDRFGFPLLSDPEMKTFRDWAAFDDFERLPLHGTFLVDGKGMVRWQDISYEPFTDPDFVLEESKRLLRKPTQAVSLRAE